MAKQHGYYMRRWRESKGFSIKECAEALGWTYDSLWNYESGRVAVDCQRIDELCALLGVSRAEFWDRPPPEEAA